MELIIPHRALVYRLVRLSKLDHVKLEVPYDPNLEIDLAATQLVELDKQTQGAINYDGVSIHWKYDRESCKLSFIIVSRQSHIPALAVKEQILKWFG